MGITAEIVEDLMRAAEWSLRVDHPFYLAQRSQMRREGGRFSKRRKLSKEAERTGVESSLQSLQKQPAVES